MFPYPFSFLTTSDTGIDQVANNYSMEFDGTNYIDCGNDASLQITGAMSVSYWFKGESATSSASGVGKYNSSAFSKGFILGLTKLKAGFWIAPTSNGTLQSAQYTFTINTSKWYHLVGVYVPSTSLTLYLDGVEVDKNETTISASQYNGSNSLQIGNRGDGAYFFDGSIDEVAIWNTALSDDDVLAIYNATDTNLTADLSSMSTPPVAWYRMGD